MRIVKLALACVVLLAGSGSARAATTTHFVERGTTAIAQIFPVFPGDNCSNSISLFVAASTSLTLPDGTTSMGVNVVINRSDDCTFTFEFGSTFVGISSGLTIGGGGRSATINVTVPVDTFQFDDNGSRIVTHIVGVNVQLAAITSETSADISHVRFGGGGTVITRNGHSVTNTATLTGQMTIDGTPLIGADTFSSNSIETSNFSTIDVTR